MQLRLGGEICMPICSTSCFCNKLTILEQLAGQCSGYMLVPVDRLKPDSACLLQCEMGMSVSAGAGKYAVKPIDGAYAARSAY